MNRYKVLVLTLLLALFGIGMVPAQAQGGILTNVITGVWLRSGPGTEWRRIEALAPGRALQLDGQAFQGEWVRGMSSAGNYGWVLRGTLNITLDQALSLPVTNVEDAFRFSAPPASADQSAAPAAPAQQAAAPAAPAESAAPGSGLLVSARQNVNMRAAPEQGAARVAVVRRGTPVLLDGRFGNGAWVRGIVPTGEWGWISSGGLSITAQQIGSLPAIQPDRAFTLAPPAGNAAPAASAPPAAAAAPAANAPVTNTAPVRGFAYGGHIAGWSDRTVNALNRSGMTWIKMQVRYYHGSDPGGLAGMIADAHARGFRILIGIVGASANDINIPGYYGSYASYVAGVAALGADAIEIWNEPNIDREWASGQISPASYTELLRQSYNAIKAANPNTLVVSGAPAPTGFFGGCFGHGCDDAPFLAGMAAAGAANYMDCVGAHYNEGIVAPSQTSGDPRGNSGYYTRYFWGMVNTYYNAFGGRRPVCFTELGYLTPEGYGGLPAGFEWAADTSVAEQAAWLDSAVSLSRGSGRVRLLIVWNIDFTAYGGDPMGGYAMIRPDGSCPACDALGR